jgi:hypothetical protein
MPVLIKVFLLITTIAGLAAAQTVPETATEQKELLQKEAVAFLRETLSDVNGMRSLENRISFAAEIASLMWFHDEREARGMYGAVIGDFRDLLMRYDGQMNALGITPEDDTGSGRGFGFMIEPTEKGLILRRFRTAMGVRQQIAMSIAEHDPELAYSFYNDSLAAISNQEFRKQAEARDTFFEAQLLTQIAEKNPAKAVQFAKTFLGKGVNYQHLELLKKIYAKDAERGAEFGDAMLSRIKTDKLDDSDSYVVRSLIEFGGATLDASKKPGGKKPVYKLEQLRELAEILAQALLKQTDAAAINPSYIEAIQKYAPGRAAQLRSKFKNSATMPGSNFSYSANAMNAAANAAAHAANAAAYSDGSGYSNSNSNSRYGQQGLEREAREKAESKLLEDVAGLDKNQLPKEARDKFIAEARKIIAQTTGRDKKVLGLSMLAAQVAKIGDRELAAEIMRDAQAFVSPTPKNYQDFLLTWMLASGYANSDPEKAFPLLEETIARANETLSAFIKVGEFMDVAEEMIQDGEVQVGAFGGQMVRGLTRELGMADVTIQVLAKADFGKMKNLTNGFDRPEIRVLAKMMVLRAVLSPKPIQSTEKMIEEATAPPMDTDGN